jgi:hypothetical protein
MLELKEYDAIEIITGCGCHSRQKDDPRIRLMGLFAISSRHETGLNYTHIKPN